MDSGCPISIYCMNEKMKFFFPKTFKQALVTSMSGTVLDTEESCERHNLNLDEHNLMKPSGK